MLTILCMMGQESKWHHLEQVLCSKSLLTLLLLKGGKECFDESFYWTREIERGA